MPREDSAPDDVWGYDLDFRPDGYWEPADPVSAVVANIKGVHRRLAAIDFLTGEAPGYMGEIDACLLDDELDAATRDRVRRVAPEWERGEDLPAYLPGEVEIARVVAMNRYPDVCSLRARRVHAAIHYRMVDEDGGRWRLACGTTRRPLSMRGLIHLLDSACELGDGEGMRDLGLFEWLRAKRGMLGAGDVRVSSVFYPQLEAWYAASAEADFDADPEDYESIESWEPPKQVDDTERWNRIRTAARLRSLRETAERMAAAGSAREIVAAVPEMLVRDPVIWHEAARSARHWNGALWDRVTAAPENLPLVAANTHLSAEWERRLVTLLVEKSASDGSTPPGPWYRALDVLAERGVLAEYPIELASMVRRIRRPHSWVETMNPHPHRVSMLLAKCPKLSERLLLTWDQRLAECSPVFDRARCAVARHRSAGVGVWLAQLERGPCKPLIDTILHLRRARRSPRVNAALTRVMQDLMQEAAR